MNVVQLNRKEQINISFRVQPTTKAIITCSVYFRISNNHTWSY